MISTQLSRLFLPLTLLASACTDGDPIYDTDTDAGLDAATNENDAAAEASAPQACPDPSEAVDPTALIDNMEDQNPGLPPISDRNGGWWTAGDPTAGATLVPAIGDPANPELIPGGRCGSRYAMRITGQGFLEWGALMGLSFVYNSGGAVPYDASFRQGVMFWARVGDTSTNQVRFAISDVNSEPSGGLCDEGGGLGVDCYDSFGVLIADLDTTWKRYKVPFLGMVQRDFGLPADHIDSSQLYSAQFNFEPSAVFDLWIDDISFY